MSNRGEGVGHMWEFVNGQELHGKLFPPVILLSGTDDAGGAGAGGGGFGDILPE